jgi:ribosomal protein L37AE/L43A
MIRRIGGSTAIDSIRERRNGIMANVKCPFCDRTNYMYLSKCRPCGIVFCDNCGEAAAELAEKVHHSSESLMMYQPVCPKCGSTDIDMGAKE